MSSLQPFGQNATSVTRAPNTNSVSLVPSSTNLALAPNFEIQPILQDPGAISKRYTDLGKSGIPTSIPSLIKEQKQAEQAVIQMPISIQNMDHIMKVLAEIDIRDPQTLQIITPNHLVNYLDDVYGNAHLEILEPDALNISEHSDIDLSTIPIDITKSTPFSFLALDASMAFLASNGTSPENVVIAENMVKQETGFPLLLSINNNVGQNLDIIHSSAIQPISVPFDFPANSSSLQVADILSSIISQTQTLQIVSPDLTTQPLDDDSTRLYEFGFWDNMVLGVKNVVRGVKNVADGVVNPPKKDNFKKFFGETITGPQIIAFLKNPAQILHSQPDFLENLPIHDLPMFNGGTFQIALHGNLFSQDFEEFDCSGFEHVAFVGPFGMAVKADQQFLDGLGKIPIQLQPFAQGQVVNNNVCRMPMIRFSADPNNQAAFELRHIDDKKNIFTILSNNDLYQIFGAERVSLHAVFNLVRFFGFARNGIPQKLDIVACLDVPRQVRTKNFNKFAIGEKPEDIPIKFSFKANFEHVNHELIDNWFRERVERQVKAKDKLSEAEQDRSIKEWVFGEKKAKAQAELDKAEAAFLEPRNLPANPRIAVKMAPGKATDAACLLGPPRIDRKGEDKVRKEQAKECRSIIRSEDEAFQQVKIEDPMKGDVGKIIEDYLENILDRKFINVHFMTSKGKEVIISGEDWFFIKRVLLIRPGLWSSNFWVILDRSNLWNFELDFVELVPDILLAVQRWREKYPGESFTQTYLGGWTSSQEQFWEILLQVFKERLHALKEAEDAIIRRRQ
jgi:hypothetical protein